MTAPPDERARSELATALENVGRGDSGAFEQLYDRTSAKLLGVCLRILRRRQDAEEVLQDSYLSIWQRAGAFDRTRGTAMTWLITLVRNRALDRLRQRGKLVYAPIDDANAVHDPAPLASEIVEADAEQARMIAALDGLDAGDAQFLRTAFLEGATYPELASRAGLPLGTVKSRIRRALLKLRDTLE